MRIRTEKLPVEMVNEAAVLVCLGKPAAYRARADYADGILAIAGLKAKRITQLESVEKALEAVQMVKANILVFCSTDATYTDWILPILQKSNKKETQHYLLAGRPGDHEKGWRDKGLDSFIYLGCNVLEELDAVVKTLEDAN
ncbi:MAG: hypothetical protein AAFP70_20625 [Calditrichota bacterium]